MTQCLGDTYFPSMSTHELDSGLLLAGSTRLHIAANNKDTALLSSQLLNLPPAQLLAEVNQADNLGRTPLSVALQLGRVEAARLLIQKGADLSLKSCETEDATLAEVLERPVHQPLLKQLVKEGLKLAVSISLLQSLLHLAVHEGDEFLLHTLLMNYEVEVDSKDHLGSSPLHYASRAGQPSMANLLLKYGASTTLQDSSGQTALHIACNNGDMALLDLFLQSDMAAPEPATLLCITDISGRTCTHIALYCRQYEALGYLLNHFGDYLDLNACDSNGHTLPGLLFYFRVKLNLIPHTAWLSLPLLSVEEATWALHHAVNGGDMALLQHSLDSGKAQLDSWDFMQLTPLMWACSLGHSEMCRALVGAGADVGLTDNSCITALHCACSNNHFHVAEYLLSLQGTDPTLFFDTFSRPLSPCLLEIIMCYFRTTPSAKKPAHWQKWLSLAAKNPEITGVELSAFVDMICPHDWLQQLIEGDYNYTPAPYCQQQRHCFISPYIKDWTTDFVMNSSHSTALKAFQKKMSGRKCARSVTSPFFSYTRYPENNSEYFAVMKFKRVTGSRSSNNLKCCFQLKASTYYPVHEAALCGNRSVLEFFISSARAESRHLHTKLMFEVTNECKQTVIQLMAEKYSVFAQSFDKSVLDEILDRSNVGFPVGMSYEQALLHYLIVSSEPDVVAHRRFPCITKPTLTPLDTW